MASSFLLVFTVLFVDGFVARVVDVDHEAVVLVEANEIEVADEAEACDKASAVSQTDVVAVASPAEAAFAVCSSDETGVASPGLLMTMVLMMVMIMLSKVFSPCRHPPKVPCLDLLNAPFLFAVKTLVFVVMTAL